MGWKQRYKRRKVTLCTDEQICLANRRVFKTFFRWEERKLKRSHGLRTLDEACFKTLYGYTARLFNVNRWFDNKPWIDLKRADIRRVYNALEDGRIVNDLGRPFEDLRGYYNKIFKAKPFELAKKADLARRVIEYSSRRNKEVRYANEDAFTQLVEVVEPSINQLLFWLAWDVGENVGTLLKLTKNNFMPQENRRTGEREYLVFLPRTKLKRSRLSRGEPTLYKRTVELLDQCSPRCRPTQRLFAMSYRKALTLMCAASRKSGATTLPGTQSIRWKDLRSGMACHLLRSGWTSDEVNARLGHAPNSSALNCYINFMALSRDDPKHRMSLAKFDAACKRDERFELQPRVIICPHCSGIVSEMIAAA